MRSVDERRRILADLEVVEPLLRTTSTTETVTPIPVPVVADRFEPSPPGRRRKELIRPIRAGLPAGGGSANRDQGRPHGSGVIGCGSSTAPLEHCKVNAATPPRGEGYRSAPMAFPLSRACSGSLGGSPICGFTCGRSWTQIGRFGRGVPATVRDLLAAAPVGRGGSRQRWLGRR